MSEYIDGGYSYARIRNNAYWNNVHLDTRASITDFEVTDAVAHLNDCRQNPTIGLLARKNYTTHRYPDNFQKNLSDLYEYKRVCDADRAYRQRFNELYPHTGKMRKFLIKTESIVLDYVKPVTKNFQRTIFKMFNRF